MVVTVEEEEEDDAADTLLRDQDTFIHDVAGFFNTELLSDVVLRVDDQRFPAHKFVLAKSSEVFMKMLYDQRWAQNVTEEVSLSEAPECAAVFATFLRYLYSAELAINAKSAVGLLCLADKYGVNCLKELCVGWMVEHCRSPQLSPALQWYPWAKALHLDRLTKQATATITWNLSTLVASPVWLTMDLGLLRDLLACSSLVVENEYRLWEAVSAWLLHEGHDTELEANAAVLLPLLRFPQMLASQLYQLEQNALVTRPECSTLLQSLLSQAYRFRALGSTQAQLGVTFQDPYYMPRDYTDLTVDTVQMHNSLRFGIQVDVKMYRGPVPLDNRDGDWKIIYRKMPTGVWHLQLYAHETAMVNSEARIQPTVLIYNQRDQVIQVHRHDTTVLTRGNSVNLQVKIDEPEKARKIAMLIKPVPY